MTYEPPSGWVEELNDEDDESSGRLRFHITDQCTLIKHGGQLMVVDKPYSATRCSRCAKV